MVTEYTHHEKKLFYVGALFGSISIGSLFCFSVLLPYPYGPVCILLVPIFVFMLGIIHDHHSELDV